MFSGVQIHSEVYAVARQAQRFQHKGTVASIRTDIFRILNRPCHSRGIKRNRIRVFRIRAITNGASRYAFQTTLHMVTRCDIPLLSAAEDDTTVIRRSPF